MEAFRRVKHNMAALKARNKALCDQVKFLKAEIRYLQKHQDFENLYYTNNFPEYRELL